MSKLRTGSCCCCRVDGIKVRKSKGSLYSRGHGLCNTLEDQTYYLCEMCGETLTGNAFIDPQNYPNGNQLRIIASMLNQMIDKIHPGHIDHEWARKH